MYANKPISAGIKANPSYKNDSPNVNRLTPEIGSIPIVLISSPNIAAINALIQFFPPSDATVVSPNIAKAKYSAG